VVRIRAVRIDEPAAPVGVGKTFGRLAVSGIGDLLFLLGDLSMLWATDRRTWGDRASGTAAVRSDRSDTRSAATALAKAGAVAAAVALAGSLLAVFGTGSGAFTGTGGDSAGSTRAEAPVDRTSPIPRGSDNVGPSTAPTTGSGAGSGASSGAPGPGSSTGSLDTEITQIGVPATASNGVDSLGDTTSYGWRNLLDGDPSTAWRMKGDGAGSQLRLRFAAPVTVSAVGLLNGYAKVDPGDGTDRYAQERQITDVKWIFDDGTTVSQSLSTGSPFMQSMNLNRPITTTDVILDIDSTAPPAIGASTTPLSVTSTLKASSSHSPSVETDDSGSPLAVPPSEASPRTAKSGG
jgi:hypothetical protein